MVYVGIEWSELPPSFSPEAKLQIKAGIEQAVTELRDLGYDVIWCGVGMDPASARSTVRQVLEGRAVDCVLIGAGLRKTDAALTLFEVIVNQAHTSCPGAALCFNSVPGDSAAAVQRWVRP